MLRVFIDMPPYSKKSNGVICLFELCKFLSNKGLDVFYTPRDIFNVGFDILSNPLVDLDSISISLKLDEARKNDWIICNDTTSKILLDKARKKGLKVILWQLAPYSFLGRENYPKIGDYNLPFSSCVNPHVNKFYYYQPRIDKYWKAALEILSNDRKKLKKNIIAIYTGKGRISKLPLEIKKLFQDNDLILFSRNEPKSRSSLFKALLSCKALISFDSLTQLNLEAASLGIPVFLANNLFPKECYEKFPVKELKNRLTSDVQTFLRLCNKDLEVLSPNDLKEKDKNTFNEIYSFIIGKSNLNCVNKNEIRNLKKFTKYLLNLDVIHPHINGGQSSGTLFIKDYCRNLVMQKNNKILNLKISLIENISKFLFKIKILNVIELIFIRLRIIYQSNVFLKNLESIFLQPYINYSKKNRRNYFFNKSFRWSNGGIRFNDLFEIKDLINMNFDDEVYFQSLIRIRQQKNIKLTSKKIKLTSKKYKSKNLLSTNSFDNPYLNLPKDKNSLNLKYKIIEEDF